MFPASSGMDPELPCLKRRPDFPAVAEIEAHLSSHKMKGYLKPCGDPLESPRSLPLLEREPHIPLTLREVDLVQCFKR